MQIRRTQFAGSWYPAGAEACEARIREFLSETVPASEKPPVGGIVPHAGWVFSGAIACRIIQALTAGEPPDTLLVFGMHMRPDFPPVIMPEGAWETPFGPLPVDEALSRTVIENFKVTAEAPNRFTPDNTIELQMPFIKYFFPDANVVALGAPPNPISIRIAESLVEAANADGKRVRVVGSTDLTHYGTNYGFTPKGRGREALDWVREENDPEFIRTLTEMDPEAAIRQGLENHNACCAGAAAAAVAACGKLGAARGETVAYATSYDKSPGESFVGYAGVLFA
jgi:MEMO1 family protein